MVISQEQNQGMYMITVHAISGMSPGMPLRWPHDSSIWQVMGAPGLYIQDAGGYSQGSGVWKLVTTYTFQDVIIYWMLKMQVL